MIDVGEGTGERRLSTLVQWLAGEHLEQDRPQRVNVGRALGAGGISELLGRHVARRAEHLAGPGLAVSRCEVGSEYA